MRDKNLKISSNLFLVLFFFISIFGNNYVTNFRCGTDDYIIHPGIIKSSDNKRDLSESYKPISIKIDYTYLESQKIYDQSTLLKVKEILGETIKTFSDLLSVKHVDMTLTKYDIEYFCEIDVFASDYKKFLVDYDVVIFPYIDDEGELDDSVLAAAGPCLLTSANQPKAGTVVLKYDLDFDIEDTKIYMKSLLLHEITHILVFYPEILEDIGVVTKRNGLYYVTSPKVLEYAKKHFDCDKITGIQLEDHGDDGSAGSHWEARYALGDYMISFDYHEVAISDLSLALFEDSGWYKVNYYSGGLFRFGRFGGCEFFNEKCVRQNGDVTSFPNDFCTNDGAFCTSGHLARGECAYWTNDEKIEKDYRYFDDPYFGGLDWVNYCPVSYDLEDLEDSDNYYPADCKIGENIYRRYNEKIGSNSLCFESSLGTSTQLAHELSICYEVECDYKNESLIVKIGSGKVTCPKTGGYMKDPDGFKGVIKCPNYYLVCNGEVWCNDIYDCIAKKSTTKYFGNKAKKTKAGYIELKFGKILFLIYLISLTLF